MAEASKGKEKVPSSQLENMSGGSQPLTKDEYLIVQAHSMSAMTKILEGSSKARDSLLVATYHISNAKATNVEIMNIKMIVTWA